MDGVEGKTSTGEMSKTEFCNRIVEGNCQVFTDGVLTQASNGGDKVFFSGR